MAYEGCAKHQHASQVFIWNRFKRVARFLICLLVLAFVCRSAVTYRGGRPKTVLTLDMDAWQLLEEGDHYALRPREGIFPKTVSRPLAESVKVQAESAHKVSIPSTEPTTKTEATAQEENFYARDLSFSAINDDGTIPRAPEGQHVMLVWWPPAYLAKDRSFLERNYQRSCGGCRLTMDRTYLNRSAVVLFDNVPTKENLLDVPFAMSRREDQIYVLWHRETPSKTYHLRRLMEGTFDTMFNYTMSYRRDSDVVWYLGNTRYTLHAVPRQLIHQPGKYVDQVVAAKRKLAVWVVSNCNNTRGAIARQNYVQELVDAGLDIDMYGRCFKREVPRRDFFEFLAPYKFYMAFENSWHCKDYLTEKFWRNGLMANAVPVVWGPSREDVAAVAPEHSYVHAEDFGSPAELVSYLKRLDRNEAEYRKFFEWRRHQVVDENDSTVFLMRPGYEPALCKLCKQLDQNGGRMPPKTLKSSISWVFGDDPDSQCLLDTK